MSALVLCTWDELEYVSALQMCLPCKILFSVGVNKLVDKDDLCGIV